MYYISTVSLTGLETIGIHVNSEMLQISNTPRKQNGLV